MIWPRQLLLALLLLALAACQAPGRPVESTAPVEAALQRWPREGKRPFFTTIHALGKRITASGVLDFHNAHDFRLTAVNEMGAVLFDARRNWAGITVLRTLPGLDSKIVETLLQDFSLALRTPATLDGMLAEGDYHVVRATDPRGDKLKWKFTPAGQLAWLEVQRGVFDTLRGQYRTYNAAGMPRDLVLSRPARGYTAYFTFTD